MGKKLHSSNVISEQTLHEILLDIKYRLDHLEDIEADNRALMVKMVKQSNSIVKFLANIKIESIDNDFEGLDLPDLNENKSSKSERFRNLRELIDEFMDRQSELKEFEEELKKNKDKLTPGQVGES